MTEDDPAALIVALVALGVSVLAAGFSGWQAVTAHLTRTTPGKATWMIEFPGQGKPWMLHNTGGSTATSVVVTVSYPAKPERSVAAQARECEALGPVAAGQSAPLVDTEKRGDPRDVLVPVGDGTRNWKVVPQGTPGAIHMADQFARVDWRDYRGRQRTGRAPLW